MKALVALLALFLLALAATTPPAVAKEVSKITVCGTDGCNAFTDRAFLRQFPFGASTRAQAPPPGPYFTVSVAMDHGDQRDSFLMFYVVGGDLFAGNSADPREGLLWFPAIGTHAQQLARSSIAGLEPYPRLKSWPQELKSPGRFLVDDEVDDGQPGTPAKAAPARQAESSSQPKAQQPNEDRLGSWSWLALPLAGFAAVAALAVVHRRRTRRPERLELT